MLKKIFATGILLQIFALNSHAALVQCDQNHGGSKNYMEIDNSIVSACAMFGVGNLNGELGDQFLSVNPDYTPAGKIDEDGAETNNTFNISYTQSTNTTSESAGTFSFDYEDFWNTYSSGAIAFKFGTKGSGKEGKETHDDQWFVYWLLDGAEVFDVDWFFTNYHGTGGGLSHVHLYGSELSPVPVPAAIPLFLSALAAFGLFRRRQRKQA